MSKSTKYILGIIVLVLVIWGLSSLGQPPAKAPTTAEPASAEPIKIGLSAPLTGEAASFGEAAIGGAELAIMEINDSGGINGRMLELIAEDDQCSNKGVQVFSKLVNIDQVVAIIGPICSAAAGPALPIAQEASVPTIITASAPALTATGNYIFRNYTSDAAQGKFAAEFIYNDLGKKKAAVIYVKNDWGQGLNDVFIKRFEELGGEVVYNDALLQDDTDARTPMTKAKASGPDVLYLPVYPKIGAVALKQANELGLDVPIVGGDAFATDEVHQLADAEGVLYTQGKSQEAEEFLQRVKEETGRDATFISSYKYDAIYVIAEAIEKVGTDPSALRTALAETSHANAMSVPLIEFTEVGDLNYAEFDVMKISDNSAVKYEAE